MIAYLALGILLVIILHFSLKWLAGANPKHIHKLLKWCGLLLALAGIILLFRLGLPYLASLASGLLVLVTFLSRWGGLAFTLFRWLGLAKSARNYKGNTTASTSQMTMEEARQILGVGPDATPREIKKAYKQLMQKLHPDQEGGSEYLATKLNQARDKLLKK